VPIDSLERELQSIPAFSIGLLSTAQGDYTPARMLHDIDHAARLAGGGRAGPGRLSVVRLPADRLGYARLRSLVSSRHCGELVLALERASGPRAHELSWAGLAGAGPAEAGPAADFTARAGTLSSQTTRQRGLIAAVDVVPTLLAHLRLALPASPRGEPIRVQAGLNGAALRSLKARLEVVYPRRLPALACLLGAWALLLAASLLPLRDTTVWVRGALRRRDARWPPNTPGGPDTLRPSDARWAPDTLGDRSARLRWATRVGALGLLWAPIATLLPAAIEPGAATEYALIAGAALGLGALTDALLDWPRALIAPALAAVAAVSLDALLGSQLLIRSLLGPNPAYGSRFYGIGNELKPALAVLVFAAVPAALYPNPIHPLHPRRSRRRLADRRLRQMPRIGYRSAIGGGDPAVPSLPAQAGSWHIDRWSAAATAGAGALLALFEGSARIGAGVGGAIMVCAGAAVATVLLLPDRSHGNRRRALAAVIGAPALGLALLAVVDLATAHGAGHYTGSVLHARSTTELTSLIARRYRAAWRELGNGLMPLATALALLLAAAAVRYRERLLAPVASYPGWRAGLAGGLTAGVAGALVEDSGPVLLVVAVFTLACVLAYLWGSPPAHAGSPQAGIAAQASSRKGFSTRTEPIS
jgi:hypothetical protein